MNLASVDLSQMTRQQKLALSALLDEKLQRQKNTAAGADLIDFAHAVYPNYAVGSHHKIMAKLFKEIAEGKKKRVIVNVAPRHGKSELTSYLFPAWFLGQRPDAKIIMATHTASLSEDFGKRVRNLIDSPEYREVFPNTVLAEDSKSAGAWNTTAGGKYYAVGVGGALAGRGADLLVIDDPHSEQDGKSNTKTVFDQAWGWYQTGPRQRLMWGGAIVVVMCMTGDTPVLMADGTEKPLRDVRPGDDVATHEDGVRTTAKVLNWQSSGVDSIFTVRTQSGRLLRANERHPFLVDDGGVQKWVRLKNLQPGMCLVVTKAAEGPHGRKQSPGCADRAKPQSRITRNILTHLFTRRGTTESGRAKSARTTGAEGQSRPEGFAPRTTQSGSGRPESGPRRTLQKSGATRGSRLGTAFRRLISTRFSDAKAAFAQCAASLLQNTILARTGTASCASTTITLLGAFEGYSATTATSPSGTQKPQQQQMQWPRTSDFTTDRIVDVTASGEEEVFDIEVERTGNFIANGVVSHNTRWSLMDLTGRLISYQQNNPDADQWEVVELPAILPSGKALWPEKWPVEELLRTKATLEPRYWNAQYQQKPASDESAIIKREWWREWPHEDPPKCSFVIQTWDTAHERSNSADYSACTTWGIFDEVVQEGPEAGKVRPAIILLDAFKARMEFPELKEVCLRHWTEWQPDAFIVEKKAAGAPLIQELRQMGIPVSEFSPSRGNDKTVRVNAIADIFASGRVWAPRTRWAMEVIEECATFPVGVKDDYVDCTSCALLRYRQGRFISLDTDVQDEPKRFKSSRMAGYY